MDIYNLNFKKKILIVEENEAAAEIIISKINDELGFDYAYCRSYSEVKNILEKNADDFFVSLLDLFPPDAQDDKIIDYVLSRQIPVIVMFSTINDNIRDRILKKNIFNYIIKNINSSYDHLIKSIRNLLRNQTTKILIIDDSRVSRIYISRLLNSQCLITIEAGSGKEALDILQKNKDIRLVITDYNMPGMDGFELLNRIRAIYPIDKLAIIGISAYGNPLISTNFLKEGANDFIYKPFSDEEFKWRINQNIELIDYINKLRDIAIKDSLTGLYNRHALFDLGVKLFENARRGNIEITIAIIDIDNFKKINDENGHFAGDIVLQKVANILMTNTRASDFVARYGGDEFCLISVNLHEVNSFHYYEKIRTQLINQEINIKNNPINITVSIGIINTLSNTLDDSINKADSLLYKAKNKGKNCIVSDQ